MFLLDIDMFIQRKGRYNAFKVVYPDETVIGVCVLIDTIKIGYAFKNQARIREFTIPYCFLDDGMPMWVCQICEWEHGYMLLSGSTVCCPECMKNTSQLIQEYKAIVKY